jgi:hypothetical protein
MHIASVQFKCFSVFRGMLQVFYMDVAKVDRGNAQVDQDVAMLEHMLQAFVPNVSFVLLDYVASVFISMLHMFHTYVASVFICMLHMLVMFFKCFL